MPKINPLANLPTVPPGAQWTAQDGNEYTVHSNGHTLIDCDGNYFSSYDLRPLPKAPMDRAHEYAVFEGDDPEFMLAMS